MSFKKRLKLAFVVIILIPIFMAVVVAKVIITYQLDSVERMYDVQSDTEQLIANPIKILNRLTRKVFNSISYVAKTEPEKFENMEYLRDIQAELASKYSFIVVRIGGNIIFAGDEYTAARLKGVLPDYNNYSTDIDGGIYISGDVSVLIKQQDFVSSAGENGSVFIVTYATTLVPQIKTTAIQTVASIVIILVVTAAGLVLWLYKGIIVPISRLRKATSEITSGNLDYTLDAEGDDEIRALCRDFEQMRIHLKETIGVRMQYEQDQKDLISNISHDLKTPLTTIKGYAEGMLDGVADSPEKQEKYLKTIYYKACDMTALVDELSLYTKLDCNNVPYNFENLLVKNYFEDCVDELMDELEMKGIKLLYSNVTDEDTRIIADPEQLKRVINNIVGNSVKYMDKEAGIITFSIIDQGEEIKLKIGDNGPGIDKKSLPYIFDRFFRADASRNSKRGGTGLGLAIVKRIIEEHSGRIWAESSPGNGTAIYITFRKSYYV